MQFNNVLSFFMAYFKHVLRIWLYLGTIYPLRFCCHLKYLFTKWLTFCIFIVRGFCHSLIQKAKSFLILSKTKKPPRDMEYFWIGLCVLYCYVYFCAKPKQRIFIFLEFSEIVLDLVSVLGRISTGIVIEN